MIMFSGRRVLIAEYHVDFRKWHQGLLNEAYVLGLNPWEGDIVVFPSRDRKKVKVLSADRTGLWVSYKKFTAQTMKTSLRFISDRSVSEISESELAMLLDGSRYTVERRLLELRPAI
jgi:hypothetical protein